MQFTIAIDHLRSETSHARSLPSCWGSTCESTVDPLSRLHGRDSRNPLSNTTPGSALYGSGTAKYAPRAVAVKPLSNQGLPGDGSGAAGLLLECSGKRLRRLDFYVKGPDSQLFVAIDYRDLTSAMQVTSAVPCLALRCED